MRRREFGATVLAATSLAAAAAAQSGGGGAIGQSGLVGTLEGPAIVTDPARVPRRFQEAPMLAEQVRAGRLPPVEERLPQDVMVIQPLRSIGRYGGTWRRGFIGPGDSENGNRLMSADKPLFFDKTGTQLEPCLLRGYELAEDGKRTTVFLRRGMRWSDGTPHTADDWVFWFEELYGNRDLVPAPAAEMAANGKPGRVVKIDDVTVAFEFDEPYYLFPYLLAGDTLVGGGQTRQQSDGRAYSVYAPRHYLKQFLPKYSSVEALNAQARAAGFNNWVQLFQNRSDWRLNRELPTLCAWRMVQPITGQQWVLERNPYFYAVDTEGNQLPYIDRIQLTLAENPEVVNLRAIAGEYDYQERFIDLGKLPVILENRQRSGYRVHLDLGFNGADSVLFPTLTYTEDKEIGHWLGQAGFRRALSLGIDREQLNEAFWLGLGTPGSVIPDKVIPESPGEEWRTRWSTHDPAQANKILDGLGLNRKDREGYRLRRDNGQRLRIEIAVAQTLSPTWPQQAEMIVQHWRQIGIAGDVKVMERSLALTRARNDQNQILMWTNNGTESLYLYPRYTLPVDPTAGVMGNAYALWFASNGERGTKPVEPEMLRGFELMRAAAGQREAERVATAREIWKLAVEQQWGIGLVGLSPAFMGVRVVSERLENVPARTGISQHIRTPWGAHPEQWYFKT
ncbi:peptide ABC transporter substrate-binding protein [Siccirubricoccus deserti]|uniref:ABC transporter substrate-binding protein n=1 Tax=Siccirubricoccus deserti TaxID=2013562 RepID=A0A9X0UJ98_9PROT|nr:ABC transporter substrate-binding protein [Siccirubricoccus deserti]MBC4017890.1 ABC transporter substrate-binding protein [Siccirubricoccus deserti]GGC61741.1 peptide ABC transporter substrate-binding protein [Siccirubricoccus deserti]